MLTKRMIPATATTATHLVVAGGLTQYGGFLATVEVLNTETLEWFVANNIPEVAGFPQLTRCDGGLYFIDNQSNVFSCSEEDLLKSTNVGCSVWTRLAGIPAPWWSSLTSLQGHVLAIGGADASAGRPTGTIYCYDVVTDSWHVIGEIPTPRSHVVPAVLPGNELMVVGGWPSPGKCCSITEINDSPWN
jgi:hypothetical protein